VLRTAAYRDSRKLDDRRNIYSYRVPAFDLIEAVLDQLALHRGDRVLDVGCGPGTYLAALARRTDGLRRVGVDLSPGMLGSARKAGIDAVLVTDATALPFEGARFDAVMANHMLYHVEDIDGAVRELRRVTRAGGCVLAVTNARAHFAEFDALLAEVSGRDAWWRPSHRFTLENGVARFEIVFDSVSVVRFEGELRVPDVAPVMRFARSMRDLSGGGYDDSAWATLMHDLEQRVGDVIAAAGEFVTYTESGVLVCR
jgi:ubiquinone/menaquinone biosynthesis C-methylase UbiE